MTQNQIIKFSYHFLVAIFLLYVIFTQDLNIHIISIFVFIIIFHLYDSWWFYNNDGFAPI